MSLLISWLGVDSRGPASIYIASDSRISWSNGVRWDYSRKVFGFNNSPDILGYCGDAFFPTLVLPQVIDLGDRGLLFAQNDTSKEKFEKIKEKIVELFKTYPREHIVEPFFIVHASRDNKRFFAHIIGWDKTNGWKGEEATFSDHSDKLFVLGSGKLEFLNKYQKYWESDNKKTSRAIFHCLCDTLFNIKNDYCGGAPQLIGLYRIKNARFYGIIISKKRYFLGMNVEKIQSLNSIEWRNELFERCDAITGMRLEGAQRQPNPCVS